MNGDIRVEGLTVKSRLDYLALLRRVNLVEGRHDEGFMGRRDESGIASWITSQPRAHQNLREAHERIQWLQFIQMLCVAQVLSCHT